MKTFQCCRMEPFFIKEPGIFSFFNIYTAVILIYPERSIAECIGNTAFPRIRVGTGDRPAGEDLAAWVLGHPSPEDRVKLEAAFDHAADCAKVWITDGIEKAMQR